MFKNHKKQTARILSLLLIFIITLPLLFSCNVEKQPLPPKEELIAAMESATSEANYYYTSTYLDRWGFSCFYPAKLRDIEILFRQNYYEEIPSSYELAKATAKDFVDNKYDKIDITDITAVTTALIDSYITAIGDKYAAYRLPEEYNEYHSDMSGEYCGIGISIEYDRTLGTMRVTGVTEGSPAEEAGFMKNDYIIGVNGVSIEELGYEGTASAIKGIEGTTVDVTVLRCDTELTLTATRRKLVDKTVYYKLFDDGIGYIQITSFKSNTAEYFGKALSYMEENDAIGIIFDLRSNPGGYLSSVLDILEYIAPDGYTTTSYSYRQDGQKKTEVHKTENPDALDVPCAVLCNKSTASAAELFTSAIRDYGEIGIIEEIIVGTQTYGKGIMQNTHMLKDGATLTMTIAYYNPPLGQNYHGEGIIPDVVVELTDSNDVQLSTALIELLALISN